MNTHTNTCRTCSAWDQRYPDNKALGDCKRLPVLLHDGVLALLPASDWRAEPEPTREEVSLLRTTADLSCTSYTPNTTDYEERKVETMKLYHFCAMRQGEMAGGLSYSDGTITSSADLSKPEQYRELKKKISEFMDESNNGMSDVILLSLTIIGEEEELRSAIERKVRTAVADQSNTYGTDYYIKEQVKAHWRAAVDALVEDALKDSTVLREKIAAELEKKLEKKLRAQLAALAEKCG